MDQMSLLTSLAATYPARYRELMRNLITRVRDFHFIEEETSSTADLFCYPPVHLQISYPEDEDSNTKSSESNAEIYIPPPEKTAVISSNENENAPANGSRPVNLRNANIFHLPASSPFSDPSDSSVSSPSAASVTESLFPNLILQGAPTPTGSNAHYHNLQQRTFDPLGPSGSSRLNENNIKALIDDGVYPSPSNANLSYMDLLNFQCTGVVTATPLEQLIERPLYVTSEDGELQGLEQTLDQNRNENGEETTPTFWSSIGYENPDTTQTMVFKLAAPFCVVTYVAMKVYRARYQGGEPIYPPRFIQFGIGTNPRMVTFTPHYPVKQMSETQVFYLDNATAFASHLIIVLHGMCQRQLEDNLYYLAIERVEAFGTIVNQPMAWLRLANHMKRNPDSRSFCPIRMAKVARKEMDNILSHRAGASRRNNHQNRQRNQSSEEHQEHQDHQEPYETHT